MLHSFAPLQADLTRHWRVNLGERRSGRGFATRRMMVSANGMVRPCSLYCASAGRWTGLQRSTAMSNGSTPIVATMGIDIGKNSFHVIGLDRRGVIVLRQKWSRSQVETRLANMPRSEE